MRKLFATIIVLAGFSIPAHAVTFEAALVIPTQIKPVQNTQGDWVLQVKHLTPIKVPYADCAPIDQANDVTSNAATKATDALRLIEAADAADAGVPDWNPGSLASCVRISEDYTPILLPRVESGVEQCAILYTDQMDWVMAFTDCP